MRLVTNETGATVGLHDYLPFGEEIPGNTAGRDGTFGGFENVRQRFTGQERDETNLDFFQARYSAATLGRFLSPDPANAGVDLLNPQSWNGYSYVVNNPLTLVDPTGLYALQNPRPAPEPDPGPDPGDFFNYCFVFSCGGGGYGFGGGATPKPPIVFLQPVKNIFGVGQDSSKASNKDRAPNVITCGSVLPDGSTVGSRVAALSNTINDAAQSTSTPYGPSASYAPGYSPLSVPGQVYRQTNFKIIFRGHGNAAFLGDAGNFAYASVSANIGIPLPAVKGVAGIYANYAGHKDTAGFFQMDASARNQIPPGYSAACQGH